MKLCGGEYCAVVQARGMNYESILEIFNPGGHDRLMVVLCGGFMGANGARNAA